MSTDYDSLYRTGPDALGPPSAALLKVFARLAPDAPLDILDLGCGQGRDALPLARDGHRVTGIDSAPAGVAAMLEAARAEGLAVEGEVADIATQRAMGPADVVLCDRVLHMLESAVRAALLPRLLSAVRPGGWLIVADERPTLDVLEAIARDRGWSVERPRRGPMVLRPGSPT